MPEITVMPENRKLSCKNGENLLSVLLNEGIYIDNPCSGRGVCGKCRVRVISGFPGNMTETERSFLTKTEAEAGIRLSCLLETEKDLTIEILRTERKSEVLTDGFLPGFTMHPDIRKQTVRIVKPSLEDQTSFEDQLENQLAKTEIPFGLLQGRQFIPGIYTAVLQEKRDGSFLLAVLEEGDTTDALYGAAVDIGTTTVAVSLINMNNGKEMANASAVNAQKRFGLDVLTRITYELEHPDDGIQDLQKTIVDSLNGLIGECCRNAQIDSRNIYEITAAANCTMLHMLLGIDGASIGSSPYAPIFVKAKDIPARDIGIAAASRGARLYCLPSVSSYIGADIVAGTHVCGLHEADGNVLFIDIGTNGEIVFSDHGRLLCCSCAAGPALEGMNISSGMLAEKGAAEDVRITENGVELQVIGCEKPVGICGSGILAAVKELLRTGIVRKDGSFVKPESLKENDYRRALLQMNGKKREFILAGGKERLLITQKDVRQVQLAKGAILSGFCALLKKAGRTADELDKVMIAGQFGAHLTADSLIGTGILPEEVRGKVEYVGNTSRTGAYMALMSGKEKQKMEKLTESMEYMELGASEGYERLFADCLIFPACVR